MSKSMTAERAIEILKDLRIFDDDCDTDVEALTKGIEALEKQIPKKPISIKNDEDVKLGAVTWKAGITIYKCFCCNSFISRASDFCNKCGQALDWSDEE